jgi:hypothetical protein
VRVIADSGRCDASPLMVITISDANDTPLIGGPGAQECEQKIPPTT